MFLSTCWLVSSLGQCSRCSLSMVEFGVWHIVHSLDSYMPVFLMCAARQSCPVLSLKFATTCSVLPLYSAQFLWISLHFFVAASLSASCCTSLYKNVIYVFPITDSTANTPPTILWNALRICQRICKPYCLNGHFWGVLHHAVKVFPSLMEQNNANIFRTTNLLQVDTEITVARN